MIRITLLVIVLPSVIEVILSENGKHASEGDGCCEQSHEKISSSSHD